MSESSSLPSFTVTSALFRLQKLLVLMPYEVVLPSRVDSRREMKDFQVVKQLQLTCEKRAYVLFRGLSVLLPLPLLALSITADCDKTLFLVVLVGVWIRYKPPRGILNFSEEEETGVSSGAEQDVSVFWKKEDVEGDMVKETLPQDYLDPLVFTSERESGAKGVPLVKPGLEKYEDAHVSLHDEQISLLWKCWTDVFCFGFERFFMKGKSKASVRMDGTVEKGREEEEFNLSADVLTLLGICIHLFHTLIFILWPELLSNPYAFCSNIFIFLVTGFTSYSFWVTVMLCWLKSVVISVLFLYLPPLQPSEALHSLRVQYFFGYWCSCAIVLVVLTPVHLETIARLLAEGKARSYKGHMEEMIRASYDACVWVDSDFQVQRTDPKLNHLFRTDMKGKCILDFCRDSAEKKRFLRYMYHSSAHSGTALLHASFLLYDEKKELREEDVRSPCSPFFEADVYLTSKVSFWLKHGYHLMAIKKVERSEKPLDSREEGMTVLPPYHNLGMLMDLVASSDTSNQFWRVESGMEKKHGEGLGLYDWECMECHCVNEGASLACALCGRSRSLGEEREAAGLRTCMNPVSWERLEGSMRSVGSVARQTIFEETEDDEEGEVRKEDCILEPIVVWRNPKRELDPLWVVEGKREGSESVFEGR